MMGLFGNLDLSKHRESGLPGRGGSLPPGCPMTSQDKPPRCMRAVRRTVQVIKRSEGQGSAMGLNINGPEQGKLFAAIESAFPNVTDLQPVLLHELNDRIQRYAPVIGGDYPQVITKCVERYNSRYAIDKLVAAMLIRNPTNELLLEFAWRHSIVKRPPGPDGRWGPDDNALEAMLDPVRGFDNPMQFLRRWGEIVKCTCQIVVPVEGGRISGTGLLVGDETVLTNYHNVETLVNATPETTRRREVRLLFDYHTGPDDETVYDGVPFKLVDDENGWLIASSEYHPDDLKNQIPLEQNIASERPANCLDFALLRVEGKPGAKALGHKPEGQTTQRGHIPIPPNAGSRFTEDFKKDSSAVFIFQHPSGEPLSFDYMRPAVLGVNANQSRAFYNVNTRKGSSGAPCFNAKLQLMALHHAGAKDWPASAHYLYNQGIPIEKIYAYLGAQDLIKHIT